MSQRLDDALAGIRAAIDAQQRAHAASDRSLFEPVEAAALTSAIATVESHETNEWREAALEGVRRTAERLDELTIDDVRACCLPESPHLDERALGQIMRRAARAGFIRSTKTYRTSTRPETHRRPLLVWRSLLRGA